MTGDAGLHGQLIINADDFGFDTDTSQATIECFKAGALTSATIMPNMPATELATSFASNHDEFSYGIHLTFVCDTVERPICPPDRIPALVREDGRFLPSNHLRLKALAGAIPVDQIALETSAQIERILDCGIRVSHIDSHGHLHKFRPFIQALKVTLPRYGLEKVRNVQNLYMKKPLKSPTFWLGGVWRRQITRHFVTTPNFFMAASANDRQWVEWILRQDVRGVLEVGVHPGGPEHPDAWRNDERLACLELAMKAKRAGWNLITWNGVQGIR
ncbi:MAG TPA: ChbG/HpnK family deacetylase [Mariprofundaceae bacterium]|nr:ChbG/HpnK family deacetylase [Mariprofundaceae bacterium]